MLESAISKLIMTILAAVADMERIRIKERTAEGRKAKRAKGGVLGNIPFGYRKVGEGRAAVLEPNPVEMQAAVYMKQLFQAGETYCGLARKLAAAGYVSRTGKPYADVVVRRVLLKDAAQGAAQ